MRPVKYFYQYHSASIEILMTAPRLHVTARKEVILAAGSFNTPHLLMLSGIGNSAELSKLGIQSVVDLPSVGKNMTDHALLVNTFEVSPNVSDTLQDWLEPTALNAELALWSQNHTGPLADFGARQIAWLRLPQTDPIFKKYRDPTPGPLSAHYEVIFLVRARVVHHLFHPLTLISMVP
jgi:choline dehydrogenase-like flavoprotein